MTELSFLQGINPSKLARWLDWTGIVASGLCFVHCWTLPVLLLLFPGFRFNDPLLHTVLGGLAIVSVIPLIRYHSKIAVFKAILGISFILFAALFHEKLTLISDIVINFSGGILLISVHCENIKKRKKHL